MLRCLALLSLLAACASPDAGPCRLQAVADLPVTLDGNQLVVVGKVDGANTNLLVDTGAETTVITAATVAGLSLPRSQRSATRLTGIGGTVSNADVFAVLGLGGVTINRRFVVAAIPNLGGVVGADILSGYDLDLDLPHRRVRLWRAAGCGLPDLPLPGMPITVPLTLTARDRLGVPVSVDGKPIYALLDSGASRTVMQSGPARQAGVTGTALAADPASLSVGVDGNPIAVHTHTFVSLALGADQVAKPRIGVTDLPLTGTQMLLGVDYLRDRRVWVAYRRRELFVVRP